MSLAGRREDAIDLRAASEVDLLYSCFVGDIVLADGEVDLSARFGWIPLLDFICGVRRLAMILGDGQSLAYDFTESSDQLVFLRRGSKVVVTATYALGEIVVELDFLRVMVAERGLQLICQLVESHPELTSNGFFSRVARDFGWRPAESKQ